MGTLIIYSIGKGTWRTFALSSSPVRWDYRNFKSLYFVNEFIITGLIGSSFSFVCLYSGIITGVLCPKVIKIPRRFDCCVWRPLQWSLQGLCLSLLFQIHWSHVVHLHRWRSPLRVLAIPCPDLNYVQWNSKFHSHQITLFWGSDFHCKLYKVIDQ